MAVYTVGHVLDLARSTKCWNKVKQNGEQCVYWGKCIRKSQIYKILKQERNEKTIILQKIRGNFSVFQSPKVIQTNRHQSQLDDNTANQSHMDDSTAVLRGRRCFMQRFRLFWLFLGHKACFHVCYVFIELLFFFYITIIIPE